MLLSNLTIRPFEPGDQRPARALILQGLGDHFARLDPHLNRDLDDIGANYLALDHDFMVADIQGQGRLVATGALLKLPDNRGRIVRVAVDKSHQGQGIGKAIVHYLLDLARKKKYRWVLVETNHDWSAAVALYRSCGFEPYARDDVSVHMRIKLTGK